ncbi:bacillithiol system redox-active protein YtxJ [uncultured Maribacter sp.]|uniref:bacillithiol system redox-active protein YtxJ n=1 Tax=uncultured Maribacter sp. TaxID=431308 RepID=UPI00260E6586|nr:bacillithiol system redox-active protein YtxJ [uncultured Maribacter sp.]
MGILNSLFGGSSNEEKKEKKVIPWIPLTNVAQLNDIEEKSKSKLQVIFKHSTTCGISRMVMNMFQETYDLNEQQADLYYLDLHSYRPVSNEVAIKFQLIHQSPQLLLVKNGVVEASSSHGGINDLVLKEYL